MVGLIDNYLAHSRRGRSVGRINLMKAGVLGKQVKGAGSVSLDILATPHAPMATTIHDMLSWFSAGKTPA